MRRSRTASGLDELSVCWVFGSIQFIQAQVLSTQVHPILSNQLFRSVPCAGIASNWRLFAECPCILELLAYRAPSPIPANGHANPTAGGRTTARNCSEVFLARGVLSIPEARLSLSQQEANGPVAKLENAFISRERIGYIGYIYDAFDDK